MDAATTHDIGQDVALIRSETRACHSSWGAWKRLYMHDDAIQIRHAAGAAQFFWIIRDSILEDVLLTLARMLDGRGQGKYQNVVIADVVGRLDLEPDERVKADGALGDLREFREKVEPVRHKRIAHNDREVVAQQGGIVRYEVTDTDVDGALESLRTIMSLMDAQYPPDQPQDYSLESGADAASKVIELIARASATPPSSG